ncbi:MAG: G8 domain-containing protein, partial [Sphingobium sp.]|nr:G8 domain-containing protein [Sphingobium sp.]
MAGMVKWQITDAGWTGIFDRLAKALTLCIVLRKQTGAGLAALSEGINVMRMGSRLLPLSLALPASLLLGVCAPASAQEDHSRMSMPVPAPAGPMKQTRWSDPASWPGGKVPVAGEAVTIGRDRNILLDVAPPALRSLTINGKLSFSDALDLELRTEWIYL